MRRAETGASDGGLTAAASARITAEGSSPATPGTNGAMVGIMQTGENTPSARTTERDRLLAEARARPGIAASMAVYESVRRHLPQQSAPAVGRTGYSTGANAR